MVWDWGHTEHGPQPLLWAISAGLGLWPRAVRASQPRAPPEPGLRTVCTPLGFCEGPQSQCVTVTGLGHPGSGELRFLFVLLLARQP